MKGITDALISLPAIASPFYFTHIEQWMSIYLAIGGGVLLTIRIGLAIREWRNRP